MGPDKVAALWRHVWERNLSDEFHKRQLMRHCTKEQIIDHYMDLLNRVSAAAQFELTYTTGVTGNVCGYDLP